MVKNTQVEQIPEMYLSTSEGHWSVIQQGMPLCKSFDNLADARRVWDMADKSKDKQRLFGTPQSKTLPVWYGDTGTWGEIPR